ncbi:Yip1 family protein [Chryseobacterium turcicum]|uniref:YIP1 family protein n=1 Tax=Chryseobacterium turcicum TaxID=2898076 RepID=A0A9Q3YYB2_9FLAO|nr:Yip1 family protein [Chryseobacterium turcicum]MCD1116190.1 YIP1 family protein [Chryseobacterium turcicum]
METKNTEDQFAEFEKYEALSDQDIFTKIWTEPRRIFRFINDTRYDKYLYLLMFLAGVASAFQRSSSKNMGDHSSLFLIVFGCVILGGALGWISYYIYAALLSWSGKWLNGVGDTSSIFRMMAYAVIPSILGLFFLFLQIAVYGVDYFTDFAGYLEKSVLINVIFWISFVIENLLSLATLVFMVIGLSEVQKISIGKAIINLLLPIAIIVVPILIIVLIAFLVKV